MKILSSELPLQAGGQIYHLNLHPEELGETIILVGDPGRVEHVSAKFDSIEVKRQNRELTTHTGISRGKRVSVVSTGMGTDNIDIVLTELDALANVDLKTMEIKQEKKSLNLIRIGTCGILQPDIPVNGFIAGEYGFGFDGLLQFYKHDGVSDDNIVRAFVEQTGWDETLPYPYCVPADSTLLKNIAHDMHKGITASAPGFFGPQGRQVRAPLRFPELNRKIEAFNYEGNRITNLEMECSAVYGLGRLLGHKTLTCCVGIANRVTGEFSSNYHDAIDKLIETVLSRI